MNKTITIIAIVACIAYVCFAKLAVGQTMNLHFDTAEDARNCISVTVLYMHREEHGFKHMYQAYGHTEAYQRFMTAAVGLPHGQLSHFLNLCVLTMNAETVNPNLQLGLRKIFAGIVNDWNEFDAKP